jgi:ubiquinone/menaquinone biosynthesis C-methylase UbiE
MSHISEIDAGWSAGSTRTARPPRAMVWVLLAASAAAMLLVGIAATALVLGAFSAPWQIGVSFWVALAGAGGLTVASLMVRSLRWVFLLRRSNARIPIRDAYIGYFAGLSLLLTPFLLGEIAVRAAVHRTRARVPIAATIVVNLWDRLLDFAALSLIAGLSGLAIGFAPRWSAALLVLGGLPFLPAVRGLCLGVAGGAAERVGQFVDGRGPGDIARLATTRAWTTALVASITAWLIPGVGFWALARAGGGAIGLLDAEHGYAWSASIAGLLLAPGGIIVTGRSLLETLTAARMDPGTAALVVFAVRLATAGVATALGLVFLFVHFRSKSESQPHFDAIAGSYDVQIPEARRNALLTRKTTMMRDVLAASGAGRVGLDVGCGQGAHVARMRQLGFDVSGIDDSAGQIERATARLGSADVVRLGSVLSIPAPDASYDFVYIVNVLHHLSSIDEQRRAIAELLRVLRPGGLLFIHEINTRNILFRFYMGYVFPSLNCIDEGVERWLLPHRLDSYTPAPVETIRYFTFLPDFIPGPIARLLAPLERLLESSPLAPYSAHFMAVVRNSGR